MIPILVEAKVGRHIPINGPTNIPKLPENEKKLNALACVFEVLFSVIMVRTVLWRIMSAIIVPEIKANANLHNRPGEDASEAPEQNHLPYPFTSAK
jgi:hypothetical protein